MNLSVYDVMKSVSFRSGRRARRLLGGERQGSGLLGVRHSHQPHEGHRATGFLPQERRRRQVRVV